MTIPNAIGAIRDAVKRFTNHGILGVGTVIHPDQCQAALDAGAEFVVSPICRPVLVPIAHSRDRPIMLGAFSPTEAQNVFESGADFVKIFPVDSVGPTYIRALLGPLPHLRIVPTSGVDLNNIGGFLRAGCAAVGLGGSLVSEEILKTNNWSELTRRAVAFVNAAKEGRRHP
jgi:2-dehydro-3-deoxyphosphogluconate aldolase/(4S)-4-hydroxy-2-oxoglutarate aldolase